MPSHFLALDKVDPRCPCVRISSVCGGVTGRDSKFSKLTESERLVIVFAVRGLQKMPMYVAGGRLMTPYSCWVLREPQDFDSVWYDGGNMLDARGRVMKGRANTHTRSG